MDITSFLNNLSLNKIRLYFINKQMLNHKSVFIRSVFTTSCLIHIFTHSWNLSFSSSVLSLHFSVYFLYFRPRPLSPFFFFLFSTGLSPYLSSVIQILFSHSRVKVLNAQCLMLNAQHCRCNVTGKFFPHVF